MKKTALVPFLIFSVSTAIFAAPKIFKVVSDAETPIELVGSIIGPIQWGSKSEGDFFKAYHLKLDVPINFDDTSSCGEQEINSLPLNQEGMEKFNGKRVRVKAKVFCQEQRTGTYHLMEITVNEEK
jgi:hypothetical protein